VGEVVDTSAAFLGGRIENSRARASAKLSGFHKAAHDIRTPLATVMQSVDALLDLPDGPSARAQRIYEVLRRNVHWMGTVLESSTARSPRRWQEVDLARLCEDMRTLIAPLLTARQQTLVIDARGGPTCIQGDYAGLARALLNLLDNASKYGPRGDQLRVRVRRRSTGTVVDVVDHGPGIPAGERHAIFRAFYRGAAMRRSGGNGSGIGLSVVKDVVTAHGGTVGVSCGGGATRVWFFLPDAADIQDEGPHVA
jgi:signal transduction histidine kinase